MFEQSRPENQLCRQRRIAALPRGGQKCTHAYSTVNTRFSVCREEEAA